MSEGSVSESGSSGGPGGLTYAQAGVDVDAGNRLVEAIKPAVRATRRRGADGEIGGFGGLFDLKAAGFTDPVLVAANDGVGTKLKVAIEAGRNDTVGIDLVAMVVNDLVVQGAEPLFFLDYYATGRLDVAEAAEVVRGIAEGCLMAGCVLLGGETAEMPGLYSGRDYDLAGFGVGAAERGALLPRLAEAREGDALIGIDSSGVHSNGFSLVRRIVADAGVAWGDPAPFAPERSLAEALLEPTRIYVRALLALLRGPEGPAVRALAHVTGGGLPDNLPRALPKHLAARVDLSALRPSPVFGWLARTGGVAEREMLRAFNVGVGMVAVVEPSRAEAVIAALSACGEDARVIGRLEAASGGERVVFDGAVAW